MMDILGYLIKDPTFFRNWFDMGLQDKRLIEMSGIPGCLKGQTDD